MNRHAVSLSALLLASPAFGQALDCAALSNNADEAPVGYVEQCLQATSASPSISASVGVRTPLDTAFTIDVRGQAGIAERLANSLYSFTLNNFPTQTLRGVTQPSLFALDFSPDGTTLFGATGSTAASNPSTLGTIDTTTGAFTVIGTLAGLTTGDSASGLAIDPLTGVAYFSAAGGTPTSSRLYTVDLASGALTLVGPITAPTDPTATIFIDIAMNCAGELYGHNISDDALYSIDPATGAGTLIGTHGLAANFAQGMDFDNSDGTLYGFIYTGTGTNRFGTFDLATGAFTTLAQDNPLGEYEGAIPGACPNTPGIFADGFETTL
jgi:hypothetical protein